MKTFLQKKIFFIFFLTGTIFSSSAEKKSAVIEIDSSKIPAIETPDFSKDLVFHQFLEDADFNAKSSSRQKISESEDSSVLFTFYKIHVPAGMDFLWLSSRLSPVYKDTIATLNSFSSAKEQIEGKDIIAPTFNGLFIPQNPKNEWEKLLHKKYLTEGKIDSARTFKIDGKLFYFFEGERFDKTTAFFFLDTNMFSPLKSHVLTSDYGYRVSPISGKWKFHAGIDLAAPEGNEVYACKSGTVKQTGFSRIYGNYVILQHYNGMTSLYAHLSKILVEENQKINGGALIAKVGSTGASTGPHLHFELSENGKSTDPAKVLDF